MSDNYYNYFNSHLESTDPPEQWQRSASYESEKVKSEKRKIQMYCDFQPAFLFPCRRLCSNKTNVPAYLQSAGNEYQDLFNPITSYLASPHTFNANIALNFSLLTS